MPNTFSLISCSDKNFNFLLIHDHLQYLKIQKQVIIHSTAIYLASIPGFSTIYRSVNEFNIAIILLIP